MVGVRGKSCGCFHHRVGRLLQATSVGCGVCLACSNLQIIITFAMVEYVGRGRMPLFL